jgi:hypothetical protein
MKYQIKIKLVHIFILFCYYKTICQQPVWPLPTNWNQVNCSFSELHGAAAGHIHAAIDINCFANNDPFNSNGNPQAVGSTNFKAILYSYIKNQGTFTTVHSDFVTDNDSESNLKKIRYGDLTSLLNSYSVGDYVQQGIDFGKVIDGGHLHFEMWIRDEVGSPWRKVDPLSNPNVNYTNPSNITDVTNPQINNIILEAINEPTGISSGIIGIGNGLVSQNQNLRVHFTDRLGGSRTPQHPFNGVIYSSNNDKIIIFGSIGTTIHERDLKITIGNNVTGNGMGIYDAVFRINNSDKYQVKFDEILDTETDNISDFYHTEYNGLYGNLQNNTITEGVNQAFGNDDYLEMRRITGETARRPHKQIGGIQSNGVWATRAKTGTPDVFATTPTEIANCPDEAKYPDGKHTLNFTVSDAASNTDSKDVITIVDNFKPFIKKLEIKFKGNSIYKGVWSCNSDCMKFDVTQLPVPYQIASAADASRFEVIATFSESMDNTVALKLTQGTVLGTVSTTAASDNKVFTFSNIALKKGTFFLSDAKDLAGNPMLNMPHPTASTCVKIPTRSGSGWTNPDNVPDGAEDNYELPCGGIDLSWRPANPYPLVFRPSTCTSTDGAIRIVAISPTGANPPIVASIVKGNSNGSYTFVTLFDYQTINTPGGTPQIQGLSEGTYYISMTDASGCTGLSGPIHLVAQSIEVLIEAVDKPCNGMNNGEIKATIINPPGATGVFKWTHNAPVTNWGNTSTQSNLAAGAYTVAVSLGFVPSSCPTVFQYNLVNQGNIPPTITETIRNPCPDHSDGSISLSVIPEKDIIITWSNGMTGTTITNLAEGTYTATVRSKCGIPVQKSFTLTTLKIVKIVPSQGCAATAEPTVTGGSTPYTYSWSDGSSNPILNSTGGGTYKLTVTDANGCIAIGTTVIAGPGFQLSGATASCENHSNGSVWINITNPNNQVVSIVQDGVTLPQNPGSGTAFHITNLGGSQTIQLKITIGSCVYEFPFSAGEVPTTKVLADSKPKESTCQYNEICRGVELCTKCFEKTGSIDVLHPEGKWLTRCGWPFLCPNPVPGAQPADIVKGFFHADKRNGTQLEYIAFLNQMLADGYNPQGWISRSLGYAEDSGLKPCAKVRYCTATGESLGSVSGLGNFKGAVATSDGCIKYKCGIITRKLCPKDHKLDVPGFTPPTNSCTPAQYNMYQLYIWKDELSKQPGYIGSDLESFINQVAQSPEKIRKSKCGNISFCLTDFRVLFKDNFNNIDCDTPVPVDPCEATKITEKGQIIACVKRCYVTGCTGECYCTNFPYIRTDFDWPKKRPVAPTNPEGRLYKVLSWDNGNSTFINFGRATDSIPYFMGKGIYSSEKGNIYSDFDDYNHEIKDNIAPNVIFYEDNLETNTISYVKEEQNHSNYSINFDDGSNEWSKELSSSVNLEVKKFRKSDESIIIAGEFTGNLSFGDVLLASSSTLSAFVLRASFSGSTIDFKTFSVENSTPVYIFDEKSFDIIISAPSDNGNVKINGVLQPNEGNGKRIYTYNHNSTTAHNILTITDLLELKKVSLGLDGSALYAFSGLGQIFKNNEVVATPQLSNDLTLVKVDNSGNVIWHQIVNYPDISRNEFDITSGTNGSFYLGMTVRGSININNQQTNYNGGKDIILVKFGTDGESPIFKTFGSNDDENIKSLSESNGVLFLGGEVSGTERERLIGQINFLKWSGNKQNAYISYLLDEDFNDGTPSSKQAIKTTLVDAQLQPNPFDDDLFVKINCREKCSYHIRLLSFLGNELWSKKVDVTAGENLFEIERKDLIAGTYLIEVITASGEKTVLKAVKN